MRVVADAQVRPVLLELSDGVGPLDSVAVAEAEEGGHVQTVGAADS